MRRWRAGVRGRIDPRIGIGAGAAACLRRQAYLCPSHSKVSYIMLLRYRIDLLRSVCDRAVDCISYFVFLQLPGSYLIIGQLTWQDL